MEFDFVENLKQSFFAVKDRELVKLALAESAVLAITLCLIFGIIALFFVFAAGRATEGGVSAAGLALAAFLSLAVLAAGMLASYYLQMKLSLRALAISGYGKPAKTDFAGLVKVWLKTLVVMLLSWYDRRFLAGTIALLAIAALCWAGLAISPAGGMRGVSLAGLLIFAFLGMIVFFFGYYYHAVRLYTAYLFYLQYGIEPMSVPRTVWDITDGKTLESFAILFVGAIVIGLANQLLSGVFMMAYYAMLFVILIASIVPVLMVAALGFFAVIFLLLMAAYMALNLIFYTRYNVALMRHLDPHLALRKSG